MIAILCLPIFALIFIRVVYFAFAWRGAAADHPDARPRVQRGLRLAGTLVLLLGAGSAAWVYTHTQPAPDDDDDVVGYDLTPNGAYPIKAAQSRKRIGQLQSSGGNYDVVADEVGRWIGRRWHGRNLATTLLVLAAAGGVMLFYFARWF